MTPRHEGCGLAHGATKAFALASVLVLGACGGGNVGFGVELGIVFDPSINDAALATIQSLVFHESGDESSTQTLTPHRAFARTERTVYRPSLTSRTIELEVDAVDAEGTVVGSGRTAALMLSPGATTSASVILEAGPISDAGVDSSGSEMDLRGDDAGEVDSPDGSESMPGGASKCVESNLPAGVLRCRSYESASDIVRTSTNMGAFAISTAHAYRGNSSLLLQTEAGGISTNARASELLSDPLPDSYSIRAFVFSETAWPANTTLIGFQQPASPYDNITLGISNGHLQSTMTASPELYGNSTVALPVGAWSCLEIDVVRAMTGGTFAVFLNDEPITSMTLTGDTEIMPELSETTWGFYYTAASASAAAMWIDEVMVASSHISCSQ